MTDILLAQKHRQLFSGIASLSNNMFYIPPVIDFPSNPFSASLGILQTLFLTFI